VRNFSLCNGTILHLTKRKFFRFFCFTTDLGLAREKKAVSFTPRKGNVEVVRKKERSDIQGNSKLHLSISPTKGNNDDQHSTANVYGKFIIIAFLNCRVDDWQEAVTAQMGMQELHTHRDNIFHKMENRAHR